MLSNQLLLKGLRSQGYTFKRRGANMDIWKRKGSVDRLMVFRRKEHDPLYVIRTLQQAGMSTEDIEALGVDFSQNHRS